MISGVSAADAPMAINQTSACGLACHRHIARAPGPAARISTRSRNSLVHGRAHPNPADPAVDVELPICLDSRAKCAVGETKRSRRVAPAGSQEHATTPLRHGGAPLSAPRSAISGGHSMINPRCSPLAATPALRSASPAARSQAAAARGGGIKIVEEHCEGLAFL